MAHVIEVQRAGEEIDDYGTPVTTWTKLATLRAEVVQQGTTEFMRAGGATDEAVMVFRTRFLDMTTADRIAFAGDVFNIKELMPIGRRKGLEIRATALTGDS